MEWAGHGIWRALAGLGIGLPGHGLSWAWGEHVLDMLCSLLGLAWTLGSPEPWACLSPWLVWVLGCDWARHGLAYLDWAVLGLLALDMFWA
jgi:hypothetical protein